MSAKEGENDVNNLLSFKRLALLAFAVTFVVLQGLLVKDISPLFRSYVKDDVINSTARLSSSDTNLSHEERLALELLPPKRVMENPLDCQERSEGVICCGPWSIDVDDWWTQNPTWEVTLENETAYCLTPIQNQEKADFLNQVHELQWAGDNCHEVETSVQVNSGFGSSSRHLLFSFWHALRENKPFQMEWNNRRWLYSTANKSSWAYCPSEDMTCYYLPIAPCNRNVTINNGQHLAARPDWKNNTQALQYFWLEFYMMRPRHVFRRKLYEMRATLNVPHPCTTMHVRRGDAGINRQPFRRYAAVQEYIDSAELQRGDAIFLLTDDETTIEEIQTYHKDHYNWIYLNRPRNRGISRGFDGHIASGDEGFDMLAIDTELRIGKTCEEVVCGESGFMRSLVQSMDAEERNYTLHYVDTRVKKGDANKWGRGDRGKKMLIEIEAANRKRQEEERAEGK